MWTVIRWVSIGDTLVVQSLINNTLDLCSPPTAHINMNQVFTRSRYVTISFRFHGRGSEKKKKEVAPFGQSLLTHSPRLYPNGRFRYPQQRPINHTALFPCYTLVKIYIKKLYISKELDLWIEVVITVVKSWILTILYIIGSVVVDVICC